MRYFDVTVTTDVVYGNNVTASCCKDRHLRPNLWLRHLRAWVTRSGPSLIYILASA